MKRVLELFRSGFSILLVAVTLAVIVPHQRAVAQPAVPPATAALSEATIRALQEALGKQGFAVVVNGALNDETRAAIRKYQSAHHLPVTGEPDKATLDKLGVRLSAAQSPIVAQGAPTTQGGMMMSDPTMMQGMMTGMMQMMQGMMGMMQGQMQPGSMQPPPGRGGMMMNCPMMGAGSQGSGPAMMQMMQGMMKMMQMMQSQQRAEQ